MSDDVFFVPAAELSRRMDRKQLSPVELTEAVLKRAEVLDAQLNLFVTTDPDGARAQAKAAEDRMMRGARLSPLDGLPMAIKDLIAVKGMPTSFGSKLMAGIEIAEDAPSAARLRAAGAVIMGKSTTAEFGCKAVGDSPLTGITRNPWNPETTPGGSSSGAGAIAASGLMPIAIGTDGGGSVRIPASFCGLFALKPQYGRVGFYPPSAAWSLSHVGPMTRTVEDAALALSIMAGRDDRDPYSVAEPVPDFVAACHAPHRPLKIAWSPTLGYATPTEEVLRLCAEAVRVFRDLGHEVEEVARVFDEDPAPIWNSEFFAGAGARLADALRTTPDRLDPAIVETLLPTLDSPKIDYLRTVFQRFGLRETTRRFFEGYDLLLSPSLPVPAFAVGLNTPPEMPQYNTVDWVQYAYPFNLTGQPAASIPAGWTEAGLPVGLQMVSRALEEAVIFQAAAQYERARPWAQRRPPVAA